jgi:hypothetical protein
VKKLICEICGGDVLLKEEEHFRCGDCGACYSADQLKKMLEMQAVEEKPDTPKPEEKMSTEMWQASEQNIDRQSRKTHKLDWNKIKKYLPVVLAVLIPLVLIAGLFELLLTQTGILPRTADAKNNIESHLKFRIESEDIALESVKFDSIDTIQFRTREEDTVGYFAYMDKPLKLTNADGTVTEYNNHFEELQRKLGKGYDPESDVKWAYIATGTYKAKHKEQGEILGEFRFVYVCNVSANIWYYVEEDYGASEDMLRQIVKNHLTAYVLLAYDIQPSPKIEITSIEKEQGNFTYYTVCGKVVVKDKYGEEYSGKFTATYQYTNYNHQFRELSTEVDELTRNRWADILK